MKLTQRISARSFIIAHLLILIFGLIFLFGLHYILNIQNQKPNNPFLNGPVTTLPKTLKLDLDYPQDLSLTFQNSVLVSGQTTPSREVLILTDSQDLLIKSKTDGSFSTLLNLDEGVNNITVVIFDSDGDTKEAQRTVFYSEEEI